MTKLKSLYFRMTIVHYLGMIILPLNAFLFTQNSMAQIVQIIIAVALVFHELDEYKNGKMLSKELIEFLKNMDNKNVSLQINTSMSSEYSEIKDVIDQREQKMQEKEKEEAILIQEAKSVMQKVQHGSYNETIKSTTSNEALESFKTNVNAMIKQTKENFSSINEILNQYTNYNYKNELHLENIDEKGELNHLVNSITQLKNAIIQMLTENKTNGLTLQNSSGILLQSVETLNSSSLKAQNHLDQTAYVLQNITQNVSTTSSQTQSMTALAIEVTNSVNTGQKLAQQTNSAMDEINTQVTSINEAINIIDKIAFQTNILSLNAAVEAATAGQEGKGFAVVAQEVRNLAERSTQAAKEIKNLVLHATTKTNDGKAIANAMIEGYGNLNGTIDKTMELIKSVALSAKEQQLGVEQINDSVALLHQQINANSQVALQTNEIAQKTSSIADTIVKNVYKKVF
ncbi:MAG: methyl-accepting chemotaxis protein [Arcobacteraceae bacterium]